MMMTDDWWWWRWSFRFRYLRCNKQFTEYLLSYLRCLEAATRNSKLVLRRRFTWGFAFREQVSELAPDNVSPCKHITRHCPLQSRRKPECTPSRTIQQLGLDFLATFFSFYSQPCMGNVALSSLTRHLRKLIRPFTTNKALSGPPLHRDGPFYPVSPRSGEGGWRVVCAGSRTFSRPTRLLDRLRKCALLTYLFHRIR